VEPVYPAELPRPGSKVTVEFEVNAEGGVANVEFPKPVAESLAAAVKTALEGWRFRPAIQDRQPVPVRVRFVFEFNRHR
jgi:TonB family protein